MCSNKRYYLCEKSVIKLRSQVVGLRVHARRGMFLSRHAQGRQQMGFIERTLQIRAWGGARELKSDELSYKSQ